MRLTFKGGSTSLLLSFDTEKKTYTKWNGIGSNAIRLSVQKELRELELRLIKNGFREEEEL